MTRDCELLAVGETMALVTPGDGERLVEGGMLTLGAGGAESNVAIGAAGLGIRAAWASRVGDDPLGEVVEGSVHRRGVDTASVRRDPHRSTGLMVKHPDPAGSKVFYYRAGSAASALGPEDIAGLPAARVVHTTGITPALSDSARALVGRILDGALAPAATSFDVNFRPVLWEAKDAAAATLRDLARRAHIVFVGRDEAESLWGTPTAEDVRALLPEVAHLVVKDGSVEAVEFHADGVTRVPTRALDVVEPVGAGDAFAAGWLAAWLRGRDATARLSVGHDSAAAVLRSPHDTAAPPQEEANP